MNCHSGPHGQVGSCTCSKGLFTRGHLENYTALLRAVEENQRSGESAGRQVYRPRLDRETVEAVSDFIGITTGDKAYQLQKRSETTETPKCQQTAQAMFSSTSARPSATDRGFWGTGCFEFTFRQAFTALRGWQWFFTEVHPAIGAAAAGSASLIFRGKLPNLRQHTERRRKEDI